MEDLLTYYSSSMNNCINIKIIFLKERTVNAALSNTFGFGGHNTSIIVKKLND